MQKKFSQKFELIEIILLCTICDFFGENIFTNYGETERDPLKLLLKSSPNSVTNLSPLTLGLLYVCMCDAFAAGSLFHPIELRVNCLPQKTHCTVWQMAKRERQQMAKNTGEKVKWRKYNTLSALFAKCFSRNKQMKVKINVEIE